MYPLLNNAAKISSLFVANVIAVILLKSRFHSERMESNKCSQEEESAVDETLTVLST